MKLTVSSVLNDYYFEVSSCSIQKNFKTDTIEWNFLICKRGNQWWLWFYRNFFVTQYGRLKNERDLKIVRRPQSLLSLGGGEGVALKVFFEGFRHFFRSFRRCMCMLGGVLVVCVFLIMGTYWATLGYTKCANLFQLTKVKGDEFDIYCNFFRFFEIWSYIKAKPPPLHSEFSSVHSKSQPKSQEFPSKPLKISGQNPKIYFGPKSSKIVGSKYPNISVKIPEDDGRNS